MSALKLQGFIQPFGGYTSSCAIDGTYKLAGGNDSLLLFNVMQLSDSRQMIKGKEWQMAVPTTEINRRGEKVSGVQAHVHYFLLLTPPTASSRK